MNEDALVGQMGLILTQLRYARRAIEDIERSTARYNSYAFASALSAGPRFGEPPLFNGALKVYVNNIHDLEPGGGIGSLLQGLLGGLGGFFGNLVGGIPGGFLAAFTLPNMIAQLSGIVDRVQTILTTVTTIMNRVGSTTTPTAATTASGAVPPGVAQTPTLLDTIHAFTALFQAAGGGTGNEMAASLQSIDGRVRPLLTSITAMLEGVTRVINGLVILVPILSGAIASLIVRIDDIKGAIIGALQFVLRNVFLIRGVVLVTIYDTLAAVARMGAGLLQTLGTAVERILASAFSVAGSVLQLVVTGLGFVAGAIQRTVNALLPWVASTIDKLLGLIARSPIFGLLAHIVRILPSILPALNQVLNGPTATLSNQAALDTLAAAPFPSFGGPPGSGAPPTFDPLPDLTAAIAPPEAIANLQTSVQAAAASISAALRASVAATTGALTSAGDQFTRQAGPDELARRAGYRQRLTGIATRADALAGALASARSAAQTQSSSGALREIATAYETWLVGNGGLRSLVSEVNQGLVTTATGSDAQRGLLGQIVQSAGGQNAARGSIGPRAVIDIGSLEILLEPPIAPPPVGPSLAHPAKRGSQQAFVDQLELQHDLEERGITLDPGAAYPQVPA
jgi:hypothetical protein